MCVVEWLERLGYGAVVCGFNALFVQLVIGNQEVDRYLIYNSEKNKPVKGEGWLCLPFAEPRCSGPLSYKAPLPP